MRQLASVQKVIEVLPIPGADRIEMVKVLGWQMVAQKGKFIPGDLAIFCEIDTLLPDVPEFAFMKGDKFRVRTRRFKGCLSQGLLLPFDDPYVYRKLYEAKVLINTLKPGQDMTEVLGFMKWEPPETEQTRGEKVDNFPLYIVPKTDEERIQSRPKVLEEIKGRGVYWTEKCDGTSFTAFLKDAEFGICSRNQMLKHDGNNVYSRIAIKYDLERILRAMHVNLGHQFALQGEICGPHIQENRMKLKEHQLFVFNIWDIDAHQYLDYPVFQEVAKMYEVPIVRTLGIEYKFERTLDELLEMAKGCYPDTVQPREGIVVRPLEEAFSGVLGGRMSFKVINNEFLLKGGA